MYGNVWDVSALSVSHDAHERLWQRVVVMLKYIGAYCRRIDVFLFRTCDLNVHVIASPRRIILIYSQSVQSTQ